jgi:hypothetical protein
MPTSARGPKTGGDGVDEEEEVGKQRIGIVLVACGKEFAPFP